MGTKEKIIAKISSIDDEKYLKHILNIVSSVEEAEVVYELSAIERKAVKEGLRDVIEGRVYTREEAEELTREWLKGK